MKTTKAGERSEMGDKVMLEPAGGEELSGGSGSSPATTPSSKSVDSPEKVTNKDATAELLNEATSLLKTLRHANFFPGNCCV